MIVYKNPLSDNLSWNLSDSNTNSLNFDSPYKFYGLAGVTQYWNNFDSVELYKKNLETKYDLLKENGWIDYEPFCYKYNSHGFRTEEFTHDANIMTLGSSITEGMGISERNAWPTLISSKLKLKCNNLGVRAGCNDTAFRLCYGWIDILNPKIVILEIPPIDVNYIEIVNKQRITTCGAWSFSEKYYDKEITPFLINHWTSDHNNGELNKLKNILAISHMCKERNIKFISLDSLWSITNCAIDYARDLYHPGIKSHDSYANLILNQIDSEVK